MRACASCFRVNTWVANASPPESSPARCEFGHEYSPHTWPTTAWVDSFSRLFSIYEIVADGSGQSIEYRIQEDWGIFGLEDAQIRSFLVSVFPEGHEFFRQDVKVRLRARTDGVSADHSSSWARFSEEIRINNRYFPKSAPDKEMLSRVLLNTVVRISPDIDMFRARVVEGQPPTADEMGPPPPEKASAGRANPVGIPHLYLAYSEDTCIYETRAASHATVSLGRFRAERDLRVLNLADIEPPDFFSVSDVESVNDQIAQVAFHRLLVALSQELRKPVRASDHPIDYIPTQYLCELAKSLGIDGVLYLSSLDSTGRNVVLFDGEAAKCIEPPRLIEVTALRAEWRYLDL